MNKPQYSFSFKYAAIVTLVTAVIILSIFMPAKLSRIYDSSLLDTIQREEESSFPESFRYSLTTTERLYILSMALNNRNILQSDYAASLREKAIRTNRDDNAASFAYVENKRGPAQGEITAENAMEICYSELSAIISDALGIDGFAATNPCSQTLYSAVDMLEPQKNVSVWQIEYTSAVPPANLPFSLMEAHVDAETGKIYSFAFRMDQEVQFNEDRLAEIWLNRLNITEFENITENSPWPETTKLRKKFATDGMGHEKTVFSVGFYEGINEVFVRITN